MIDDIARERKNTHHRGTEARRHRGTEKSQVDSCRASTLIHAD